MKTLYIIGGTMGVGKTTVCQLLKHQLDRAVFLDGDWCWDAHPFAVTEETKAMVLDNICHLLNNFLACSAYEHVIFCWVLHQQEILDTLWPGSTPPGAGWSWFPLSAGSRPSAAVSSGTWRPGCASRT